MSRGGFKGRKKLPGAEFSWQSEGRDAVDNGPTPLFPKYLVHSATELSPTEKDQVDHYRKLREQIHDGPYYTVLSGPPSYKKEGPPARAQFDSFQGMASYGQRYVKKTRTLPNLRARSYAMNFFPKELWSTLDPNYVGISGASINGVGPSAGRKRGFEDLEDDAEDDDRKRQNVGEDEGEEGTDAGEGQGEREGDLEDEEEEGEEEIVDDDFEDDEDDMGGDYNAEQYFDGGDEDVDPFDGGGGDDGDIF